PGSSPRLKARARPTGTRMGKSEKSNPWPRQLWCWLTLAFPDQPLEAAYSRKNHGVVSAGFVVSIIFAGILAAHLWSAEDDTEDPMEIALPSTMMLVFSLYFGARMCIFRRELPYADELLALLCCLLQSVSLVVLQPLRMPCAEGWLELPTTQILCLLLVLQVPLRATTWLVLLLASMVGISLSGVCGGSALSLMGVASLLLYGEVRRGERLRRATFLCRHQRQELSADWKAQNAEAKSNMALARALQTLAGRRCDVVVILDADLKVWRPTQLQEIFFQQDRGPFMSMVQRVREHKAGESLPLTLPSGCATTILEYAGFDDDRFVMSILLHDYGDQVYLWDVAENRKCGLGLPARSWEPTDTKRPSSQPESISEETAFCGDSLCYSQSESAISTRRSDRGDNGASVKVMVDKAVQAEGCSRQSLPRPPRAPRVPPLPRPSLSQQSSQSSECGSGSEAVVTSSPNRLIAPAHNGTSDVCLTTSLNWLMQHWNFSFKRVHCCPMHAAIAVAKALLKFQQKKSCNALWSCFTG
ncbi:unnamed protein product, partial [Effrenium voratum]